MTINNPSLYDAAYCAIANSNVAWIAGTVPSDYNTQLAAATVIALQIDSQIAPITPVPSLSQLFLMQSIVEKTFINRYPLPTTDYSDIAASIASQFNKFSSGLKGSYLPIPGPATYWFHDDDSDISLYKKLLDFLADDPIEMDMNVTLVHSDGEVLLAHAHITDPGFPGGIEIPAGSWTFVIYRNASVAGVTTIVFRIYTRTTLGVETEIFNFSTGLINDATVTRQVINVSVANIPLADGERLVVKPFATNTQAFPVTVHMYHDGLLHNSYLQFPQF